MRQLFLIAAFAALAPVARAQQPARPDTTRADSLERARLDSLQLVKDLERMAGEPRATADAPAVMTPGAQRVTNPRLQPDLSFIGDFVGDLSPRRSSQEDGSRASVREIELAAAAAVDPYFRVDFILGISDEEKIAIEEAYATTTSLPWQTALRIGRFHMPFGKQNTTHRPELHTVEYPWVVQRLFGPEGFKGTGLYASKIFAPLGFYQELQLTAIDNIAGEAAEGLATPEPSNRDLGGLGYSARLRNYWDVSEASNIEVSASALTGRRPQPLDAELAPGIDAVNARQGVLGADVTFRWRPLQQGLYKSFILQGEVMRQVNDRISPMLGEGGDSVRSLGPSRDFTGAYLFGRWQLTRRAHVGARGDWLQDPEADGRRFTAASAYLEFFPSEFSKLNAMFERVTPSEGDPTNRILLQATFSIGPHRPHPF